MPRIELELDDSGEIFGNVPPELDAILKRIESTAHGKGYGKGVEKAAEDAKKQIEETIRLEVAKREAQLPFEKERYEQTDAENKALKAQITDRIRETDRAMKSREEAHAKELLDRAEALKRRNSKIQDLVKTQIRGEAVRAGARDESLSELEAILGAAVAFDDDMEPFVRGSDGLPLTQHGKNIDLQTYVHQYVDSHPWHKRPVHGAGGGARGGASFHAHTANISAASAKERIESGDRSADAINDLWNATRTKRAS